MGFFLSSLQNQLSAFQIKVREWAQPLQNVRDYHGVFKSVCDTFVIRREQFSQIFGNEQKLALWQGSSTINALQVFCGLGFYSSCSGFRLKLKFLFALFDFNEIKSISVVDLEYMILSILNFTYRMLGRTNSRADELRLAEWLMRFVNPHKRMNINSLARFCQQSEDARQFLKLTGNITEVSDKKINEIYDQEKEMEQSEKKALLNERKAVEIHNKLAWFSNFTQKLTKPKYKKEIISTSNISWVYGIDLDHFRIPFIVLTDGRILYSISTKLIIYCPKAKSQIIYSRHTKRIESFAIYQPSFIVASSQGEDSPRVHIWDYRTLQTVHIIQIDHSHKVQLLTFSPFGTLITIGARDQSPVSLFDSKKHFQLKASFAVSDYINILTPFYSPLQMTNLSPQLADTFVLAGKRSIIIVNSKYKQQKIRYESNITSLAVSYMSAEQPFLRYFTCNMLRLFIVTSHQSGSIIVHTLDLNEQQRQFEKQHERQQEKQNQLFKFDQAPKQIILTSQAFIIVLNTEIKVYDLNIFSMPQEKLIEVTCQPRIIRLSDVQNLRLLSQQFLFAGVNSNSIFLITVQGDFLEIGDREIGFNTCLHQQQNIKRLDEFVKLGGKLKALCLAQKQNRGTLMIVSQNTKIFQIDPYTHKVSLMLQIKYQGKTGLQQIFQEPITVIDYGVSQQGPAYIVCGSQTGKLLIKTDQEEIAKIYDCQSQITDLKISRDASYLLVATLNSLMFFQLLPSLSSPRKITFQNESPMTLNFLDNPRFCSVGTSAKNIYLIQVPQLRHRNVQKDNQCFSVTKMVVDFPHRLQSPSSKVTYSRCYIGGDMKFYLLTLTTGQILYFPSMSSLPHKNYLLMRAHQSSISNVVVSEDQSLFYTVGESDNMLVEWSVKQEKPTFAIKHQTDQKDESPYIPQKRAQVFNRMKLASEITNNKQDNIQLCTFFFRGTKSNKLNRKLHQLLRFNTQCLGEDQLALMKRHCRAYLKINSVYGLQSNKIGQVCYLSDRLDDNRILYSVSRFLIETQGQGNAGGKIYQTANNIAYFSLTQLGEPIYAQSGRCPRIFVSEIQSVKTLHKNGLIHFAIYGDFILSLGIQNECYSINLHNYRTGQLISQRTTYYKITSFLMTSPNTFISLPQIKLWNGLIASQTIGIASSGAVLPNNDICLGGIQGQLSILSKNGLFTIATNAHNKQIVTIKVNSTQSSFQIITASLDQSIKIWNYYFQLLHTINLVVPGEFKMLKELQTFGMDTAIRSQAFAVRSLDCRGNKILAVMSIGQIWEYEITSHQEKVRHSQDPNSSANIESDSNEEQINQTPRKSQVVHLNYQIERKRLLNANCSQTAQSYQRYITFDVHPQFPLFASAGSDGRVIFRNYISEQVVGNYICERDEQIRVRAVRFSPKGRMFVIGLTAGVIMTFFMDLTFNNLKKIASIQLHHFQTFKMQEKIYQIMTLDFSDNGEMFAVSYFQQTNLKRQRNGQSQQSTSLIRIYKAKQEKSQNQNEAFYEKKDEIRLRQEQSTTKNSRCAVKLQFDIQNKSYLFIIQEYFDSQGMRLFETKGKYSVYCLQDKSFLSDQFSINWQRVSFPGLINLRYHDPSMDQTHDNYIITAMIRYKDILIYGGNDGRIHLLKLESLDISEEQTDYRTSEMCLSRIYSALTSPITQLRIAESDNRIFLFVSAFGEQCIVKFQLIQESPAYFLQHQPYPLEIQDPMKEYLNKDNFYLTINNRQPLRQELSNILEDVQNDGKSQIHLQFVKSFGRRALDRRYNLTYFDDSILYSLGPNLVVQNLKSNTQYLLKADPSPYSHCPQISAFYYNTKFLIMATQQQRSNIYVWDIKSKSCITSMQIQCSFVLNIKFIGQNCAVYYGINDKYEPIISLLDWRKKIVLGSMRLAFTGLSSVRDICAINLKEGKQFVTCGYLHLCLWQIRGDTLIYNNFNSQSNARYICIKQLNNYIITGCQQGHLYLWYQFELIHILQNIHDAAVRCLEVDVHNQIIVSGGKDGLVVFVKIQESRLSPFNRVQINKDASTQKSDDTFQIEYQIQSLSTNPSLQSDIYQTLLVGTRSGSIYQIQYSQSSDKTTLLYQHHDNQTIVSVTFSSYDKQSFFTLTNAGLIQRYNLNTLICTKSVNLGQRALKIQSCGEYLLICCRQEIIAYRIMIGKSQLQRSDTFCIDTKKLQEQNKELEIIRFCLSKSEKILAICIKNCSKEPTYQINIYNLNNECLHQLTNLKHEVDYLDFSVDDKYLLFKDRYEEIGMISLEKQFRRINTIFVQMGIQWQQQALRLSPNAQSIYYSYSCQNKITAISRLGSNKLIVGDQMGTVRIFDYPCPDDRLGELHLHCYCVHMNDIAEIVVHPQLSYVLSIGVQDRSLVLWKVQKG